MGVGRTILTMILAFSVAILPAVGGAVTVAKAVESSFAVSAQDCCEHHGTPCDQGQGHGTMDDCASTAACATHCFNFAGASAWDVPYAPVETGLVTSFAGPAVVSHSDPPPFPPPRV